MLPDMGPPCLPRTRPDRYVLRDEWRFESVSGEGASRVGPQGLCLSVRCEQASGHRCAHGATGRQDRAAKTFPTGAQVAMMLLAPSIRAVLLRAGDSC